MTSSRRTPIQGHFARKRFGQNFLVDRDIINAIVDCIGPRAGEQIVEIGPGLGALTGPLAEALGTPLHVVELDRDLIVRLHKNFGERLVVHAGDALAFDFGALAEEARATLAKATAIAPVAETPAPSSMPNDGSSPRVQATTGGPSIRRVVRSEDAGQPAAPASQSTASLRIVGNLPYNISSPLLFHLMRFADRVIDQHFMLQDEVVERMVATPGSKAYSRLSVMLQFRYAMDKLLDVPPESFDPAPKVNSAIVRMLPHPQANLPDVDPKRFAEVVGSAFSQRRKMLRNTLGSYRDRIDFEALGFDLSRRAEDVSVAEYVTVAQKLAQSGD